MFADAPEAWLGAWEPELRSSVVLTEGKVTASPGGGHLGCGLGVFLLELAVLTTTL